VIEVRVEKISDTQVKFFINRSDLSDRNIDMSELAFGSERAHDFFQEMMSQAAVQCGFELENSPIMIEAVNLSTESMMILVTKLSSDDEANNKLDFLPFKKEWARASEFVKSSRTAAKPKKVEETEEQNTAIYSFDRLDHAADVSRRLADLFTGSSSLFKEDNRYYLVLHNDYVSLDLHELGGMLGEYGQKHVSSYISLYYLWEHGEVMIKKDAVKILAENL